MCQNIKLLVMKSIATQFILMKAELEQFLLFYKLIIKQKLPQPWLYIVYILLVAIEFIPLI